MSELEQHLLIAAVLITSFAAYKFWPRKQKDEPLTELGNCKKCYSQIVDEINYCSNMIRLNAIQQEADEFLDDFYEKTDSKTVRMMYRDLCLKIGYKKNKITAHDTV